MIEIWLCEVDDFLCCWVRRDLLYWTQNPVLTSYRTVLSSLQYLTLVLFRVLSRADSAQVRLRGRLGGVPRRRFVIHRAAAAAGSWSIRGRYGWTQDDKRGVKS